MKSIYKVALILFLIVGCQFSTVGTASAQCAMCRRTAETNLKEDNRSNVGKNLNKGILYLLSVPYLIGAIGLFAWYSERKKKRALQEESKNKQDTNPERIRD